MKIKELVFDENDNDNGIFAVSFVENPAIEKDFIFFSKEDFVKAKGFDPIIPAVNSLNQIKHPIFGWTFWKMVSVSNEPWQITTSREFCKKHANPNNNVYHIDEIRGWNNFVSNTPKYQEGWNMNSNFCSSFTGMRSRYFLLDKQMYNCRHMLVPIETLKGVPPRLRTLYGITLEKEERFEINFEVSNKEQRIIRGVAMIPNVLIYRKDPETNEEYYVYFKKETIKKLKDRYGFNREITIQHKENITGNAILLNSWIYPDEKNDNCEVKDLKEGSWCLEYKILNTSLWEIIKDKGIKGFSVEALLSFS